MSSAPSNNNSRCPYALLGVDRRAELKVIRRAYHKMAKLWHPDRNHHNEDDRVRATNVFQRVSGAYTVLSDAGQRRAYDRTCTRWYSPPAPPPRPGRRPSTAGRAVPV